MYDVAFTRKLIKGKIAETIFQKIFEGSREYIVLPFGYEHTNPVLRQFNYIPEINKALKNISDTPDFALIGKHVKYRTRITSSQLVSLAKGIAKNWGTAYLFLVTPEGFYFDTCQNVIENRQAKELSSNIVSEKKQAQYQKVLHEYLCT